MRLRADIGGTIDVDFINAFARNRCSAGRIVHANATIVALDDEEFLVVQRDDGTDADVAALRVVDKVSTGTRA